MSVIAQESSASAGGDERETEKLDVSHPEHAPLMPPATVKPHRVVVLGSPANEATVRLVAEWRALGINALLTSAAELPAVLEPGDTVVGRLDVLPGLNGVEPGLLALLLAERRGLGVINPASAMLDVHDKLRTDRRLAAACVPHPRTVEVDRHSAAVSLAPPLVLKPRFGSWGRDVFLCADQRDVKRCIRAVRDRPWFRRHGAIAQELIPPVGHDLRVVIARGRVVGSAERTAAPGEWRTNVSLGGSSVPTAVTREAAELAQTAAAAVGMDLVGVDLLPLADGTHVVLELNGAVEFDAGYSLAGHDLYRDAAEALRFDEGDEVEDTYRSSAAKAREVGEEEVAAQLGEPRDDERAHVETLETAPEPLEVPSRYQ